MNTSINDEATQDLVVAISDGRACLLLGQDHTEGLVERVLKDLSTLKETPIATLKDGLSEVDMATLAASMADYLAPRRVPLIELASLPWSSVVSTAIDAGFPDALAAAGTTRRLVELGAERIPLTTGVHSPATLHLFQLIGRVDGSGDLAPPNAETLPDKLLLALPSALSALPQLLGTRGVLVIEGMIANAWLEDSSWAVLSRVLRKIPAGRIYWFGWAPDKLRAELEEIICFVDTRLTATIADWMSDNQLSASLEAGRKAVFGVDDHVCRVGISRHRKSVRFSAKDWRELRRIGSVIDDSELDRLRSGVPNLNAGSLAGFVARSHIGVPDWASLAMEYCFPRDAYNDLIKTIVDYLHSPKTSLLDESGGGEMRQPLLLSGPPAIGKSVGLLYTAWELRNTHGIFIVWLLPGISGLDLIQVERVCRMAESRGVSWTVLVVDGLLPEDCSHLLDKLLSDGRNVILISSETTTVEPTEARGYKRFPIATTLSDTEISRWKSFLERHGIDSREAGGRDFLERLCSVLPETRYGSMEPLLKEYEGLLTSFSEVSKEQGIDNEGPLAQQLRELFPELTEKAESQALAGRFDGDPFVRELVEIILFCARADLPISTDTLFILFGNDLLSSLQRLFDALGQNALIQEIKIDNEGTLALTTAHSLHAQWLIRTLRPDASSRLEILQKLVTRTPWDLEAYPGENPTQDFVIRLVRLIGPRGRASDDFSSIPALKALAKVLAIIWERHVKRHPGLLTLEAMIRGDIAQNDTDSPPKEREQECKNALELLDAAIEVLRTRRPSEARNFELQRALTLAADIRGTQLTILQEDTPSLPEIQCILEDLQADVMMARSYDTKYHPLDILYWANRNARTLLQNNPEEAATADFDVKLLETMQMALEVAEEEQITDREQRRRLGGRKTELAALMGQTPLAHELAVEMRSRGDFTGELVLSRIAIDDAPDHQAICRDELKRFLDFGPVALTDVRVLRYLCQLWIKGWAGPNFGKGSPVCCSAPQTAWEQLQHITKTRLSVPADSEHPLTTFLCGWAQIQLGDRSGARETFSRLDRLSVGMKRRVGELAVVSNEDGHPRPFTARVQARKGILAVLRVDGLAEVLEMHPEIESIIAPSGLDIGEVISVAIALNYRGMQVKAFDKDRKK